MTVDPRGRGSSGMALPCGARRGKTEVFGRIMELRKQGGMLEGIADQHNKDGIATPDTGPSVV